MRLFKFLRSEDRKHDLDDEIAAHLALAAADKQQRGSDADAANREARREFGNVALVKDVTRDSWGWVWLERLLQDARYALRQMRKSPLFAAAVIGTLALGIAAAATMFTVVDRVLLRPLPYNHSRRLVEIYEGRNAAMARYSPQYLDISAWRQSAKSLEGIAFYDYAGRTNFLQGKTSTESVSLYEISSNLFSLLGVRASAGRDFRRDGEALGQTADAKSVVLSDTAWRNLFGSDPSVIGKSVKINNDPYIVVGVMPRGFSFPFQPAALEVWTVAQPGKDDQIRNDNTPNYSVIARLQAGYSIAQATAELNTLQAQIAKGYPKPDARKERSTVTLDLYADSLVENNTKTALEMLLIASGVLWLIACVNATNLLLARATTRGREVAVRGALGAARFRVLQQFTVEGLLLSWAGAAIGMGLALTFVKLFAHEIQRSVPLPVPSIPNASILLVLLGLTIISAFIASIWPAWIAIRAPIEPALRQGGLQSGTASGHKRLRNILVVVEIALSLGLLANCALLMRTIYSLAHVPLGFRTDHIIVANLQIPGYKFSGENMSSGLYMPLLERVKHLPGIDSAGLMSEVPLGQTFWIQLTLYGDKQNELPGGVVSNAKVNAKLNAVSPELQSVFHFKMLAGRFFNKSDTATSLPVVVVNRAFVNAYAPGEGDMRKVVGMKLWHLSPKGKQAEIIGVLDDFKQAKIFLNPQPELDVVVPQITPKSGFYDAIEGIAMDLAVRTQRPLAQVVPELREALRQADPALAGANITTMNQIVEDSYGSQRLAAHLLESFAGAALLLCIAGLYGLLAYVVSQRTREMGVRFALGAQRSDVMRLILRHAAVLILTGVALGLGLAFASTRLIRSYLYGVSDHDAWTMVAVALLLIVGGAAAAYMPARRAAQVNPVDALRSE